MGRWVSSFIAAVFVSFIFLSGGIGLAKGTSQEVHITILHTNDMHSRIKAGDDAGKSMGMAEIAAAVKAERAKNPNVLLMDAGDTLHGMPVINISHGENMVRLLNLTGYDCMAPGNHDYNYGAEQLENLSKQLNFPILSANTVDKRTGKLIFPAYKTMVVDGVKIAVFGLTTPETAYKTSPENVRNIEFLDPIACAQTMVKQLRADHDVLIAVTHLGIDLQSAVTSDKLAAAVPGIDVIIDGHSHTELPQGLKVGKTLIAQTGCYDHNLGVVHLTVRNHQLVQAQAQLYSAAEVNKIVPEADPAVSQAIQQIEQDNQPVFAEVVVHNDGEALSDERQVLRCQETALGNLLTDAFRYETQSDVAIMNSGGIRSGIPAGDVTRGDVMAILPFGDTVRKVEVTGNVLRQVLEHSVSAYPAPAGSFLQVSGVDFTFDPSQKPGQRLTSVNVGGQALDPLGKYTVTINDFLAAGGDGYTMLQDAREIGEYGTCEELFMAYLQKQGVDLSNPGRIHVAAETDASKPELQEAA